jgi:4-hydroxythreonine-4-phosphate dehydrogenase
MMLTSDNVRVALATNHTSINNISNLITKNLILNKLYILNNSLKRDFAITCPRIALLGLNPHSSDNGLLGNEEEKILIPAINEANNSGVTCTGPLSADGFWGAGTFQSYDAILAMYHDQGLAPFKALFQDTGVNFTAGLSFVRTAPAHGTAYNIAGKNIANPSSLLKAIYLAIDVVKNRTNYYEATANPLKIKEQEKS